MVLTKAKGFDILILSTEKGKSMKKWNVRFMYVCPEEFCGTESEPVISSQTVEAETADWAWHLFLKEKSEFMPIRFYRKVSVEEVS